MLLNSLKRIKNNADDEIGTLENPGNWLKYLFGTGESKAGVRITPRTSILHPDVYACVNILADDIAKFPIKLFKYKENSTEQIDNSLSRLIQHKINPYMTSFTWKKLQVTRMSTYGNSYNRIIFDKDGNVVALQPLLPEATNTNIDPNTGRVWYSTTINGKYYELHYEEVLHFKNLSSDGIVGQTPISVIRENAGTNAAATQFTAKFYKNGGAPFGLIKAPTLLGPEGKQVVREEWEKVNSNQSIGVLDAGLDYTPITMKMIDAQFIETMKWNRKQIAAIYKVPLHKLNELDKATFSNIEHQSIEYVKTTLQPLVTNIEQELNDKLLFERQKKQGLYFKFNMDSELRGDMKTRAEYYEIMQRVGAFSANDVLKREDMPGIGEIGDEHYGNLNLVPLSAMKEYQLGKVGKGQKPMKGGEENEPSKEILEHEKSQ
ncbi:MULTISPECIES: phage portal protein [Bacillus amyloliquefaciens group]|uniref:phage portal protein n=1 Tax=Bacillus amyloliquefaciens group TaxID=1938374 RepID=UPI000397B5DB|nr:MULTISPECIES: phage portal protein [Bacillus amyloliquefaciens group]ERH55289.1 phage portal protein [Bacillus amyloliquefaciens EGD-AQ14]MDH3087211.1 phage portal protein [Bacillus velezensis]MEC0405734.1 phage portal protein [Bacillus velezensis]WEY80390.1 phage portal protein [Bacillus velezensis]